MTEWTQEEWMQVTSLRKSLADKSCGFAEVRVITLDRDKQRFVNHIALQHRKNDEDQRRGCNKLTSDLRSST